MKKATVFLFFMMLIVSKLCFSQQTLVDPSFNPIDNGVNSESGANGVVTAITVQPDGKILIGGLFSAYNGHQSNYIARLTADGLTDSSFNIGGSGANGAVNKIALQPDGKILLGGTFTTYNGIATGSLARLNADGSLDASFNSGGTGIGGAVSDIAVLSDNGIVLGGSFTIYNGVARKYLIKLNPDGSSNDSFNQTASRINKPVSCLSLQSDGKLLVGGAVTSYSSIPVNFIFRIFGNGSLDQSFVNTGEIANSTVNTIAIQNDGKIIAGGRFKTTRMNTDGSTDLSYNLSQANSGFVGPVNKVVVQQDGKIVIISGIIKSRYDGVEGYKFTKKNSDGTNDLTFFYDKQYVNENIYCLETQPDGKILIGQEFVALFSQFGAGCGKAYYVKNGLKNWNLLRYNTNGTLDFSFNFNNKIKGADRSVLATAVQADGKILIGGYFNNYNGEPANYLVRLNADGSRDIGFNANNIGPNNYVNSIIVLPDGKIMVSGLFSSYNKTKAISIIRLMPNGAIDKSFVSQEYIYDKIEKIYSTGGGKYYVLGYYGELKRINSDGSFDSTFTKNMHGFTYSKPDVKTVSEQQDGKIIVGGSNFYGINFVGKNSLARLDSSGFNDPTFIGDFSDYAYVYSSAIKSDGKILLGGDFTEYYRNDRTYPANKIIRLLGDGRIDKTFNRNGTGFAGDIGTYVFVDVIKILPNNQILIGGNFTSYNGHSVNNLVRLNEDGSYDETFNPSGFGANGYVRNICLIPNSDNFYISGDFSSYNGVGKNRIARLIYSQPFAFAKKNSSEEIMAMQTDETIRIFPNPSSNDFKLQSTNLKNGIMKIRITDQAGRTIKQFSTPASQTITFGEELNAGIYFAEITQNDRTIIKRIVKL